MDFDRLANRHRDAVLAQMVRVCGSREDAEDTLVEALLAAYRALPTLRDEASFRAWLAKIARRACHRLRSSPRLVELDEIVDLKPGPDAEAESKQMKECLEEAVRGLPRRLQEAYLAGDVEGLPDAEGALALGISLPAFKSRLHRARRGLREALDASPCAE